MKRTIRIKLITVALIVLLGIGLVACGEIEESEHQSTQIDVGGLVLISRYDNFIEGYIYDQNILYDPDTFVMYSMISTNNGVAITVMYNADGTLKLYNPDK